MNQGIPNEFMTQRDGTVRRLHQLLCGLGSMEFSKELSFETLSGLHDVTQSFIRKSEYSKDSRKIIIIFWRCEECFVKTIHSYNTPVKRLQQNDRIV